jgi:polysaccharide deacetylase family protein (PEP-CTERM system associated)
MSGTVSEHPFLFGVDLEDVRLLLPEAERGKERVPANTHRFLDFLRGHHARATFFTVGNVARAYPSLIQEIVAEGHEIACHGREHVPLDRLDAEHLRADLQVCLEDFARAGAADVCGFRAPIASLVERTRWAYDVLADSGFSYSSSVLAARNPLYGWPEYGPDVPRRMHGIWEIPVTLSRTPGITWPVVSGVYFRAVPTALTRTLLRRRISNGQPVVSYLHPYDVDVHEERFMYPQINGSRFYNWLLYWHRDQVFDRLEALMELGLRIIPYRDYVTGFLERASTAQSVAG